MSTLQDAWGNFQGGVKSALNQWTALRLAVVSEASSWWERHELPVHSSGYHVITDTYVQVALVMASCC